MVAMDRSRLAHNLARSLTCGSWSRTFIHLTLTRRFPRPLQHVVDDIGSGLIRSLPYVYAPSVGVVASALKRTNGFEEVFRYCTQHEVWPEPDLSSPVMAPIKAFATLDVAQLPTADALAEWLLLPIERLEYLADPTSRCEDHRDAPVHHYNYVLRSKKSGRLRIIEAPKRNLKAVQRQILHGILDRVPIHENSFGFAKGRNCLQAANRHVGEEAVICFDLKNFFPSIGSGRIFGLFRCLGYPYEVARLLAALCTSTTPSRVVERLGVDDRNQYRKPHLPQGSPASPALANLAVFTLDRRLTALAKRLNANYSRYADDLSFSGDKGCVGTLLRAVPQVVDEEGFRLNPAKTRVMSRTSRQIVTGVVVNEHLNVDRRMFDHLKAIIHACAKSDDTRLDDAEFRHSLLGRIGWVETVNPQRGQKLLELLSSAMDGRRRPSSASA